MAPASAPVIEMESMLFSAPLGDDAAVLLARRQHVADEEQVELAALGQDGGPTIVVVAEDLVRIDRAMAPARDVMAARIGEQAEMHWSPRHVLFPAQAA